MNNQANPMEPGSSSTDALMPDEAQLNQFITMVQRDPAGVLSQFQALQQRVDTATSTSSVSPAPPAAPALDPQIISAITQAVYQSVRQSTPPPAPAFKSEKLPDIAEYDGDMDRLDAWEQSLVHRMNANHDRYPMDRQKIAYGENRLTIGKKAHNLMGQYRVDGLCSLTSFQDWRIKLRQCCGNPYEAEDARTYLREQLRQGQMPFDEYYNLFLQKKERSQMEDASLIDALKRNVNYQTQVNALSWRNSEGRKPSTYSEYVQAFKDTDEELRQLKHRMPKPTTSGTSTPTPPARPKPSTAHGNNPLGQKTTQTTPIVPAVVTPPAPFPGGEPMDLSSAMAIVKGHKLSIPGVKDICDKWRLCYYCKLQHLGKTAKDCPNKTKPTGLRSMDLDDSASVAGGVSLPSENA